MKTQRVVEIGRLNVHRPNMCQKEPLSEADISVFGVNDASCWWPTPAPCLGLCLHRVNIEILLNGFLFFSFLSVGKHKARPRSIRSAGQWLSLSDERLRPLRCKSICAQVISPRFASRRRIMRSRSTRCLRTDWQVVGGCSIVATSTELLSKKKIKKIQY